MINSLLGLAVLAAPILASSCNDVPTPEQFNVNKSQVGIFNGHILLSTKQRPPVAGVDKTDTAKVEEILKTVTFPWKNNTVPYLVSFLSAEQQATLLQAMAYWESVSCVKFREADLAKELTPDYTFMQVMINTLSPACHSHLGMVRDGAFITMVNLADGCDSFAIVSDLLAHALGIYNTGGAITDKPSIATINAVNELYKCNAACPSKPECFNGGSPSKDCTSCVCPSGWAGDACDETSATTRFISVASTREVKLDLSTRYYAPEESVIIAQAPAGKKLQATVKSFGPNPTRLSDCFTSCTLTGVQITGSIADKTVCNLSSPDTAVISSDNWLNIRLFRSANYAVQSTITLTVV